jgi:hypothetical protein
VVESRQRPNQPFEVQVVVVPVVVDVIVVDVVVVDVVLSLHPNQPGCKINIDTLLDREDLQSYKYSTRST